MVGGKTPTEFRGYLSPLFNFTLHHSFSVLSQSALLHSWKQSWKQQDLSPPFHYLMGCTDGFSSRSLPFLLPQSQQSSKGRRRRAAFSPPVTTLKMDWETVTAPKFKMSNSDLMLCWACQAPIPRSITGKKQSQWLTYAALSGDLNIASVLLHGQDGMPVLNSQRFELLISLLNLDTVIGVAFHIAARIGSQTPALNHSLNCSLLSRGY